jgi:N6-adenosine-specific RNA methylase IME4
VAAVIDHPIHPAADLFPLLGEADLAQLADDIRASGLRMPIVLYRGAVLDGRNRLRACKLAGVAPRFEEYTGGDPVAFVISANLHRRHLDAGQRAMAIVRAQDLASKLAAEARARSGTRTDLGQKFGQGSPARTDEQLARMGDVSDETIRQARTVLKGVPELAAAVEAGRLAVSAAAVVAEAPAQEQRLLVARGEREILAAAKEIKARKLEVRRAERFAKLAEIASGNTELPVARGPWPVILADPPWRYEHSPEERAIENHYPTMALEDICALGVGELATPTAALFLWATSPKLAEACRVLEAWGFNYRTHMTWVKDRTGMGLYVRTRTELLLLAVRGNMPCPAPADRPDSVLELPRREHSRKPDEVYGIIERMYPGLPRVELFARRSWPGWDAWGNQAPASEGEAA